ncbi:MAG: hypothetical protein ACRDDY_14675, partial [Clostridium sp.]|uniref:hypothetical protein n=1 Tax=Clostridium sp. TaxID=1506 RepID=UPI003EE44FFF
KLQNLYVFADEKVTYNGQGFSLALTVSITGNNLNVYGVLSILDKTESLIKIPYILSERIRKHILNNGIFLATNMSAPNSSPVGNTFTVNSNGEMFISHLAVTGRFDFYILGTYKVK